MVGMRSGLAGALAVCAVGASSTLLAVPASADAGSHASCVGIEASSISPKGSLTEFPGGMQELTAFVRSLADELGISPGAVISFVASLHEGSHAACDEATE
jgi:hypothetical protein